MKNTPSISVYADTDRWVFFPTSHGYLYVYNVHYTYNRFPNCPSYHSVYVEPPIDFQMNKRRFFFLGKYSNLAKKTNVDFIPSFESKSNVDTCTVKYIQNKVRKYRR